MEIKEMLLQVQRGTITVEEAEAELKDLPFKDLGYAKLDYHRKLRSGFPETVFCQGKPDEYLGRILSAEEIKADPQKTAAVINMPLPKNVSQLHSGP